jgi:membrane protein involved in colicin uptake
MKQRQSQQPSSLQTAAASTAPSPTVTTQPSEDFGAKLRQAALDRISGKVATTKRDQPTETDDAELTAKKKQDEEEEEVAVKKKEEEAAAAARAREEEEAAKKKKDEEEAEAARIQKEAEEKRIEAEQAALKEAEAKAAAAEEEEVKEAEAARQKLEEQTKERALSSAASSSLQDAAGIASKASEPRLGGLRPGGLLQPKAKSNASATRTSPRYVYTKQDLLR